MKWRKINCKECCLKDECAEYKTEAFQDGKTFYGNTEFADKLPRRRNNAVNRS
jgi:hypothetical protein